MPNAADIIAKDKAHHWHHLFQHQAFETQDPKIFVGGEGARIRDIHGTEYLDASSGGVWCVNVGYGRESMARAVYDQLLQLPYYAGVAGTVPAADFAAQLAELLPGLDKMYFASSGSEANEKAIKMVRQIAELNGTQKKTVIYRDRDYHGTTIACLAASGQEERKEAYGPFPDGFAEMPHALNYRSPFGPDTPPDDLRCAWAFEEVVLAEGPDTVGAVLLEPITAGGGVIVPPDGYYEVIREICDKYGILLIMDEVVCGFGRTGEWFGFEHWDVVPDLVTMAKGIASSYAPLSAVAAKPEVFDAFLFDPSDRDDFFRDISTYGGCTAGFAAGLENLRIIEEEKLVENAREVGAYLIDRLQELEDHPNVGQVRGVGLFAGVELVEDQETREPASEALMNAVMKRISAERVLIGRTRRSVPGFNNTLNLAPPLIVTRSDIDEIFAAVKVGIEEGSRHAA